MRHTVASDDINVLKKNVEIFNVLNDDMNKLQCLLHGLENPYLKHE